MLNFEDIMNVETEFCDNYFPPSVIVVMKIGEDEYKNKTEYREPEGSKYPDYVIGIWRVKYKTLNPNYYCEGQNH